MVLLRVLFFIVMDIQVRARGAPGSSTACTERLRSRRWGHDQLERSVAVPTAPPGTAVPAAARVTDVLSRESGPAALGTRLA